MCLVDLVDVFSGSGRCVDLVDVFSGSGRCV